MTDGHKIQYIQCVAWGDRVSDWRLDEYIHFALVLEFRIYMTV